LSPRFFQQVETVPEEPPFARELIERLGLRGINAGSGRVLERGWLNTDLVKIEERDGAESELGRISRVDGELYFFRHDATEPYPIESESFEWAFSEHFIEHISLNEAIVWLAEIHRLLKPGGLVRITTPNLATFVRAYMDPHDPFHQANRDDLAGTRRFRDTEVPDRPGWMVNYIFYGWRHRWVYDFGEMRHALVSAGFDPELVVERGFGAGAVAEVAALDLPNRAHQSLYVEARRSA